MIRKCYQSDNLGSFRKLRFLTMATFDWKGSSDSDIFQLTLLVLLWPKVIAISNGIKFALLNDTFEVIEDEVIS